MLDTAIAKLATYDGTNPADVRDALARRFKASSSAFAMWITFNLRFLRVLAPRSEYVCQKVYYDCGGLCQEEAPYAWAPICGALAPVRVCDPRYFGAGDTDRCISSMNGSTSTDVILIWVTAANQTVLVARYDHS